MPELEINYLLFTVLLFTNGVAAFNAYEQLL